MSQKMVFSSKASVPQTEYFRSGEWAIPGSPDWTMTGHSRALERTGFWIPQLRIMLDAGLDLPTGSGARPRAILVTHGHIDHMNALPTLLRHTDGSDPAPVEIFAPAPIVHRLRQYTQLSWAVKVDDTGDDQDLPDNYALPPEKERNDLMTCIKCGEGEGPLPVFADTTKRWHAVLPGSATASAAPTALSLGKKGNTAVWIRPLELFRGRCSCTGYLLSTPPATKKQLKPQLTQDSPTQRELGQRIQAAKKRGEDIYENAQSTPEIPHLAFCLDTTVEAFDPERSSTANRILSCPVIVVECTYLEDSKQEEATKRGHVWWGGLLPQIRSQFHHQAKSGSNDKGSSKTWVLVHFSLRYSDEQIQSFFDSAEQCRVKFVKTNPSQRPPDVVLWLDSAPCELWVDTFLE